MELQIDWNRIETSALNKNQVNGFPANVALGVKVLRGKIFLCYPGFSATRFCLNLRVIRAMAIAWM